MKAEVAEKKEGESSAVSTPENATRTNTPDIPSEGGDSNDETETVHSRTTTNESNATAATSSTATAVAPPPAKGKDDKKVDAKAVAKEAEKKGNNLVGKINNLVTSDLDSITSGRDFLFISESRSCFPNACTTQAFHVHSPVGTLDVHSGYVVPVRGARLEVRCPVHTS